MYNPRHRDHLAKTVNAEQPSPSLTASDRLIDVHCHRNHGPNVCGIVSRDTTDMTGNTEVDGYFSLGIHPWFIEKQDRDTAMARLLAGCADPKLAAIGECGLDKCISTPLELQLDVFIKQALLAQRLGMPLIIHCVRAFNELLQSKQSIQPGAPWIIHGFSGKPALAEQLIKHGCYVSFGKALLHENSGAARSLLSIPIERVFLETDAAEDIGIGEIYAAAAKIRALPLDELQRQIVANFERVFIHD